MCGQDNLKQQKAYSALTGPTCQTIWNRYIIHEQNGERYEAAADGVFPKEQTKRSFLLSFMLEQVHRNPQVYSY